MFTPPKLDRYDVACLLLGAVFAGTTLVWVMLDRAPPNWDDAWYLTNSLTSYDALTHGGVAGYLRKLDSVFGFKAPLIAALPTPFYLLFGRRWHAAYLVKIAAMAMLFVALRWIARRWWNARAAVCAIAIAGTMPLLYGLSRWYMVEYSLTALLAVAVWVLIESDGLERSGMAVLFGALCGLGLLLKVSFPLFILPPFLFVWIKSACRARALLLAGLPCLVLALPWYAGHLRPTIANAFDAGFGVPAAIQGTGPIWSFRAVGIYLSHVATTGVSPYYAVLSFVLILSGVLRPQPRVRLLSLRRNVPGLLLAWALPFAVFLFGGNKDVRYIAPILPAFALLCACLLDFTVPRSKAGNGLAVLLLAFPLLQMVSVSFGLPRVIGLGYARSFQSQGWPHDEILKSIAAHSNLKPGARELLLVGVDRAGLNANNVELAVVALELPFNVETTAHENDFDVLRQRLSHASFFLHKEGGEPESPVFNPFAAELARAVKTEGLFRELPSSPRLPDGGVAHIYRNSASYGRGIAATFAKGGLAAPEEFAVDFGGMLALTGTSVERLPDATVVKFRWRCVRSPDRDYWCFTHLIDPGRKIVAQLDHRLLGGEPPLSSWRAGDGGEEEIRLRLPTGVTADGLRLRFGLYDPPSGSRLRIAPLQGRAAVSFALADEATALLSPN